MATTIIISTSVKPALRGFVIFMLLTLPFVRGVNLGSKRIMINSIRSRYCPLPTAGVKGAPVMPLLKKEQARETRACLQELIAENYFSTALCVTGSRLRQTGGVPTFPMV
jgi:hypothetical protein